ncbi:MAG: hypothetical protein LBC89_00145, partial [Bacteroidales bacterium]|nr:hypothetical protein [Bacteroidales bacterium]
ACWTEISVDERRSIGYEISFGKNSEAFMNKMGYKQVPTQIIEQSTSYKQTVVFGFPRANMSFDNGCTYTETEKIGYVPENHKYIGRLQVGRSLYNKDNTTSIDRYSLQYRKSSVPSWLPIIGTAWKAIVGGEHDYKSVGPPCIPNVKLINEFRIRYGNH